MLQKGSEQFRVESRGAQASWNVDDILRTFHARDPAREYGEGGLFEGLGAEEFGNARHEPVAVALRRLRGEIAGRRSRPSRRDNPVGVGMPGQGAKDRFQTVRNDFPNNEGVGAAAGQNAQRSPDRTRLRRRPRRPCQKP